MFIQGGLHTHPEKLTQMIVLREKIETTRRKREGDKRYIDQLTYWQLLDQPAL
jgi:hypothetical protein